jgi:hypothetical protein
MRLQVPVPTKLTVPVALTVQTEGVVEVAVNTVPSPEVVKVGLKLPPLFADAGMLVIDTVGVAGPIRKLCGDPVAAV